MAQYGDPRLQALYNLGQTFSEIPRQYGQQRLQEAKIGLEEKKLSYDMEMQQAKYGLEAAKQQYELPGMKLKAEEAEQKLQQMETLKQTPVNLGAMFKQLNVTQDKHDWALKVTKNVLDALDLDLDDEGNVHRSTGEPLTQYDMAYGKEGQITGAILSSMTDKWRETEGLAKQYPDDPDIQTRWQQMQEKGKANVYEESYNEKIQGLGQLQSAFGIDQKIIDKLMPHVERDRTQADYYRKQQEPTTETEKLLKRIDELPPGSPKKDILTARLEKLTQKTGEKIEIDATTGKVTITRGELGKDEPTRPTPKIKSDIQSALLASQDSMARLKRMETTFNRDYLNIGKRIGFAVTGWQEKLEGTPLESILGKAKPKDVKEATKYWVWRQDSVTNLNKEIKWLTGAAMNKEEVPRLQQEVPNPGLGIFDGDSPSQFDSKLKNKISQTKLYIARYNMYLKQGVTPDKIKEMGDKGMLMSETQIKQKINEKAKILEKSGLSKDEIINQLEKEFFIIKAK